MTETAVVSWAAAELGEAKLGDARLNLRQVRVAERLGAQSSASIPVVCDGWAETQATHRLLAHEAVTDAGGHAGRGAVGGAGCLAVDPQPGDLGADKPGSNAGKALQRSRVTVWRREKIPETLPSLLRNLPGKRTFPSRWI